MAKFTPVGLQSGFADTASLNSNFAQLETLSDLWLSRDGTAPNSMAADIDMDNFSIMNANVIQAKSFQVLDAAGSIGAASNVTYDNTTSGLVADDVQEAIDEVVTDTQASVDLIEARLDTNENDIDVNEDNISMNSADITNLNGRVTANEQFIDFLNESLSIVGVTVESADLFVLRKGDDGWLAFHTANAPLIDLGTVDFTGFLNENLGTNLMDLTQGSSSIDLGSV